MSGNGSKIKDSRKQIPDHCLEKAQNKVKENLVFRLHQKGPGIFASKHEVFGVVAEEYKEVLDALHKGDTQEMYSELNDLAVACILGMACIDSKLMDW
jgi:phosphoribosyl-ATP pyrophosphohydrolase